MRDTNGRESGRNAAAIGVQTGEASLGLRRNAREVMEVWSAMISGRSSLRADEAIQGGLRCP